MKTTKKNKLRAPKKAVAKVAKRSTKKPKVNVLNGISDIRRFFFRNETPIYFISATNFNLLGADEWIKGFKFVCYIECFDGLHPNVFSPHEEMPHEEFQSIEDINNYLLEHKEVVDYIKERGGKGKVLFLMFDEKTERLAKQLGLEVCFPSAKMRNFMDNKVNTNRIAEKAKVPCVPYILSRVKGYDHLNTLTQKKLGTDLVIQTPFGDSGHTTFFISNRAEYAKHAEDIEKEKEVKIMKRINCKGSAIEACVTQHGTIVAPLMTELVGFKELTPYKGGWCGNEIFADAFTPAIRKKAKKYTEQFGNQLRKEGYKGYFELDFLIDQDTQELYLGELNPRITGASSITNHAVFALSDVSLFLFHMLEWMNQPYKISVNAVNSRWFKAENIDSWGQLVIKYTDSKVQLITDAPRSGIYKMKDDGTIEFSRMDTHRRAVESEKEAFFLRISRSGDYFYEGADMGILVMRGRLMTDEFKLRPRASQWISAIKGLYKAEDYVARTKQVEMAEIGGFKMM
ncbi:MAG: biotin carboxylase [Cytophagales bacterium]|nr:biotin carboxylase [Cytophagales bacterium]